MLNKAKIYKLILSIIAFSSFIYWGLDGDLICKVFSSTTQQCGYSDNNSIMYIIGSGLKIMLISLAAGMLISWVRKD